MANARRHSIFAPLAIAIAALHELIIAAARSIGSFVGLVLAWIAPEPQPFLVGGYSPFAGRGDPLDAALQNGLRHEAHVSRRSAARHT